ncbi:ATP-binding protein [Poseidonocella sp. HB161398]|uniref:hybrid sensor histidine kinase/response regulator n=1 Tax=Poseidonocella sp. HB161398 TaxID=2320855 RepID=UPI00110985FB|nr:ATP-binding protein [Poseidonocella sp. HB161398]
MSQAQQIVPERRRYNQYVADETLEDYALRFTARSARLPAGRVAQTALGAIAFLACEAIGGALTLSYGTANALVAIALLTVTAFAIGLPIVSAAGKAGLDIDLLTRAAGFGYLGSTITSLIYATFTFVLFAIEASIMSVALEMVLGLPLWLAHLISALVVLPIAAFGIRRISRLQLWTQPVWLVLQVAPLAVLAFSEAGAMPGWLDFSGAAGTGGTGGIDPLLVGASLSLLMSLLPQIGEQVDYLRFMPAKRSAGWWGWLVLAGPGWVFLGAGKLVLGSMLAWLALSQGVPAERAAQPAEMFRMAFEGLTGHPGIALALTGIFVCICQVKINVTNAYAGSIAWSNTFSRLTHSHPGRVVWLVFNTGLALFLMEFGIFRALESILDLFAILAVGWLGAIAGDLVVSRPLGLAPKEMEFKRAHLYDINPVGGGAMLLSVLTAVACLAGFGGEMARAFCVPIGLATAFAAAPLIAWATGGRFYIARRSAVAPEADGLCTCGLCENRFDPEDMAQCPAYALPICSLCCSLEGRCHDRCKTEGRASQQAAAVADWLLPPGLARRTRSRIAQVGGLALVLALVLAGLLGAVAHQLAPSLPEAEFAAVSRALWAVFAALAILSGLMAWFLVLNAEGRRAVEEEFERQAGELFDENARRRASDEAAQKAREAAEAANFAKSRFLTGLSHELRSPLNSIFGYAQLMERAPETQKTATAVIRRSAEHLTDLIEGLQDISRVESGTLVLSRDRIALRDLLEQLAGMFRLQAEAKGIGFSYEPRGRLPRHVMADRKRLRQVLINLLANAVKFTETGEAGMRASYRGSTLEIEVFDTGIGIPEADLERIFQPFDRGSSAAAQAIPGTGLGLTITKLLSEIMGGTLSVESRPGAGTRITLRLMMFEAAGPAAEETAPILGYAGPRRRVLLVDDTAEHLELARRLLAPLGFAVSTARSGSEALRIAPALAPDLAVLDVSMPGMTGWELAAKLRALFPGLRILMVSANAQDAEAGARREAGADHDAFLAKPFEADALFEAAGGLLDLAWIRGDAPEPPAVPPPAAPAPARPAAAPAGPALAALRDAAGIGHRRGVTEALDRLEAEGTAPGQLARWRALAARFDLPAIAADLQEMPE